MSLGLSVDSFPQPPSPPPPFPCCHPYHRPFPLIPMDNAITFAIWSSSVLVFIVLLVQFCVDLTRNLIIAEYNDEEPADAAVLRSAQHEERVPEWMQRMKTMMMESQDGFVLDKDKASNGYGGGDKSSSDEAATECVICLEEFQDGDLCKVLPQCNHVFHKECIISWMIHSNACPMCRAVVATAASVSNLPV